MGVVFLVGVAVIVVAALDQSGLLGRNAANRKTRNYLIWPED
jgi:hypothetical protein